MMPGSKADSNVAIHSVSWGQKVFCPQHYCIIFAEILEIMLTELDYPAYNIF